VNVLVAVVLVSVAVVDDCVLVVLVTVPVVIVFVFVVTVPVLVVSVFDVEVVEIVVDVKVQSSNSPYVNSCTALSSSATASHVPSLFKNPSTVQPRLLAEVLGYACFCSTVLNVSIPLLQLAKSAAAIAYRSPTFRQLNSVTAVLCLTEQISSRL
jgi:hypothetical protein